MTYLFASPSGKKRRRFAFAAVATLVAAASCAIPAHAAKKSYKIVFSGTAPVPVGGFVYDDVTKVFQDFRVRYQGKR